MTIQCKCGCGESFSPSRATVFRMKRGDDVGYRPGHKHRGAGNPRWKGGRFVSADGYVYLLKPNHPNALKAGYVGYVAEHRMVMSDHLGRPLLESELVHHQNENKADNRLDNLELTTRADHAAHHGTGNYWAGGRTPITCATCGTDFLPLDRRNDYGAKYCGRACFQSRNHPRILLNS